MECIENKLHVSWSDSSFFPWLNETTVLDYFCDVRNPFYNVECNNQFAKMQNISLEQLRWVRVNVFELFKQHFQLYKFNEWQRVSAVFEQATALCNSQSETNLAQRW